MSASRFWRLEHLSNDELTAGLERVVGDIRGSTSELIAYLGEVEERRLHLLAAYGSMFEFCVERLGFSEDEACRRIEVARLARRFPALFPLLAEGRLSLSAAALLKPYLAASNVEELLAGTSGKSVRKAKEFLAARFPSADVPSTVRKLPERTVASTTVESSPVSEARLEMEAANMAGSSSTASSSEPPRLPLGGKPPERARAHLAAPLSSERYAICFTASKELKDKLELARDLLRHASPSGDFAPVVERALDLLLAELSKRRFGEVRKKGVPRAGEGQSESIERRGPACRYIARAARRTVAERDGLQCSWTDDEGRRCSSRAWLEYDHRQPFAQDGLATPENLRLLCRAHNRLEAERAYGRAHMDRAARKPPQGLRDVAHPFGAQGPEGTGRDVWLRSGPKSSRHERRLELERKGPGGCAGELRPFSRLRRCVHAGGQMKSHRSAALRWSLTLLGSVGLAPWACSAAQRTRAVSKANTEAEALRRVQSNVTRADYAGSASCEPCHGAIYQTWQKSPMHRMTRSAETDIRAHFDGAQFRLGHDRARVEQRGADRFLEIDGSGSARRYRVTKVIGGRHREDFVGVEVSGAAGEALEEDAESPSAGGDAANGREQVLPLSWVYATSSWRYKGYSVMLPERPALRAGPVWAATCIGCHNTLPYLTLAYDDLLGPSAPAYQGSVHDRLLPAERLWQARVKDEAGLKQVVATEIEQLGGPSKAAAERASLERVLGAAISTTRRELDAQHLVELGVGCESCHYGAREHLADTGVRPSFGVESSLFEIAPSAGAPTRAEQINRTCAHCHSVLLSSYPWTWEGKRRRDPVPGGSSTNSGEGRDFLLGGCSRELACSSCHDPHAEDSADQLAQLAAPRGNALCVGCHQQFAAQAALTGHTHHPAGSAGSACVECHMPRKNMGLDYHLTRYHRIGSPTDAERVLGDRPLECALCHADRSVESLASDMERWWHKSYPREALRELYGADLNANTLQRTLERGKPHEQAVAIATFGEQRVQNALPQLLPQLTHEYPLVRFYTKAAIERITGQPLPVDVNGSAAEIRAAANSWWAARRGISAP